MEQARKMVKIAYQALDEKKGEDIKIINLEGISVLADYFIIAMVQTPARSRHWLIMWKKSFTKQDIP